MHKSNPNYMTRFHPFKAFIYLLLIALVIVLTLCEEVLHYLLRFYQKARRNYLFVMKGQNH